MGAEDKAEPLRPSYAEGGSVGPIVKNVANVIEEPQERINPYTGEPYDVTAGSFNMDVEDRNNREDPLRRLGFVVGGAARVGNIIRGVVQSPLKNLLETRSEAYPNYRNLVAAESEKELTRLAQSPVGIPRVVEEVLRKKTPQRLREVLETEFSPTEKLAL